MRGVCCESEWHVRQFKSFSDVFFAFLCLCGYLCLEWQGTMSDARIFVRHRAFPLVLNPWCPLYPYEVEAHAFFPFTPQLSQLPQVRFLSTGAGSTLNKIYFHRQVRVQLPANYFQGELLPYLSVV